MLDVEQRRLDLEPADEIAPASLGAPRRTVHARLPAARLLDHVLQADQGCDFDFLPADGAAQDLAPRSIPAGWHEWKAPSRTVADRCTEWSTTE